MSLITFKELSSDDGLEVNKRAQIFEQEEKISSTKTFARELVQNSLDARIDPSSKAILKFKIHKNLQTKFINDLREELSGPLNYSQSLDEGVTKNVLVVEEFGTSGLDGSIETISDSNHSGFWHNTGARKGWGKQKEDGSTAGGAV